MPTDTADRIARLAVEDGERASLTSRVDADRRDVDADAIAARLRLMVEALEDIGNKKWGHRRGPQHIARAAINHALRETGAEPKPMKPEIVCLCGSGRFREAFERVEFDETLAGCIVLTIGCNTHDVARSDKLREHKPALDRLHLRKIDLADRVKVLNVDGYIGDSTRAEIEYARSQGKRITYLEPQAEPSDAG